MYKILIVEDEPAAADGLRACIERYGSEHGEQFQVSWAKSALELDLDAPAGADLIFMDIDLPGENGLDSAIELRRHDRTTPLVFVTNLAQCAVRGYQADALDFIVKPYTYGAFAMRMDRAMEVMRRAARRSVTVRSHDGLRIVAVSDLVFVDVNGHNLTYHLADGSSFSARDSLSHAAEGLGGAPFLRVSSGCLINMGHVRGVRDAEVTLTGGERVWISRANKRRCLEEISRYLGSGACAGPGAAE